jgi:AcrR family transcriptional regulator
MARTQSASAHRKVLDAALELIAERGLDATSMDAIARASGVSKATIYKHWADKDALLLDVMSEINELNTRPKFDSGDTRADMAAVLSYRPVEKAEIRERVTPHFVAYSATNQPFGTAWRNMVIRPPRRELTRLMKAGIRKGELPSKLDIELSLAILLGPTFYWYIFLRKGTPDPRRMAQGVVDAFWKAFGTEKERATGPEPSGIPRARARGVKIAPLESHL